MSRANNVEHITITSSDDNSTSGNFSTATSATIDSVLIENTGANDCYVTWGVTSATATSGSQLLRSGEIIPMDNLRFIFFAIINKAGGNNNTVVVTGNYA